MNKHELAMARLKQLTPYMRDGEREKLVAEKRSETYATFEMGYEAGVASKQKYITELEDELMDVILELSDLKAGYHAD